ncbi:hypothetical protein CR513_28635, partial [Mucuna pruriens]
MDNGEIESESSSDDEVLPLEDCSNIAVAEPVDGVVLTTPDMMYQPWCIRYPEWKQVRSYKHKCRLTHLLPEFHGLVGNTQQFGIMGAPASKIVNEVVAAENKITKLTSLVRQLAIGQHHSSPLVRECGMYGFIEHPTNACPILQEIEPRRYQPPPPFRPQQPMQLVQQSSLEELVEQMATNNIQFQENVSSIIQDLQT